VADGRARIAITYATGTLVSVGPAIADRLTGRGRGATLRPLSLWLCITLGALLGAAVMAWLGLHALWCASGALLTLGAAQMVRRRRRARA